MKWKHWSWFASFLGLASFVWCIFLVDFYVALSIFLMIFAANLERYALDRQNSKDN